ncbi:hypothetical protein PR202_ga27682 [Eleusine coracana subsp. coracana]|uniref:L-gulonolactone oxidase 2-like C-terminal domain-containing protein n=1 Tax=Eleusine coracana subsp. coracana TaxID=191504 RepID=A0AAV5DHS3_ELECO|nr:hypothetical protein PR202_ga27682 [Eleusine coracana subsp. coracana]
MILKDLFDAAAAAGMALPNSPYFYGLTIGGPPRHRGTRDLPHEEGRRGARACDQGQDRDAGAAVGEIAGRLAIVREIGADDPDLNAAKVSLGVLGVNHSLTRCFKRSLTILRKDSDADLVELVSTWGHKHEFGDMPSSPRGPFLTSSASGLKRTSCRKLGSDDAFCQASSTVPSALQEGGFGFLNDGKNFTGYPVVGYNHKMQASGSCIFSPEDGPEVCVWNPRINGTFVHDSAVSVTLAAVPAFISDLMRLRDRNPKAFCTLDLHLGILFRYIKGSTAYLGKTHDSVEFDLIYYRSREPGRPIMHADLIDEIEQNRFCTSMLVCRIGARTGTNVFNDTAGRFPRLREFLDVKARFDPDGVFSSQWSDQILGINGSPVISTPGCAVEGLCTCTQDSDCAPGYVCSQGKVYPDARVCTVRLPQ